MFSQRLKALRKERGLTQQSLADFLEVRRSTYGEYERGKIMPPYDKIQKLANYFNVSVDYLMGATNFKTVDEKIDTIAKRDITDIKQVLDLLIEELKEENTVVKFDGLELSQETKQLFISTLETAIQLGKIVK